MLWRPLPLESALHFTEKGMKIGFIGLGIMERPMALNLLKGCHEAIFWAQRPAWSQST